MLNKAITYNSKGEILKNITAPPEMLEMQVEEGEVLLVGKSANPLIEYVNEGIIVERPNQNTVVDKLQITADGVDAIVISETPTGFFTAYNEKDKVSIFGEIFGNDTFSTTIPGTYKIKIEAFPYLDFEATIEAI